MKQIIRPAIHVPYSLHDMHVTAFDVTGDCMVLRTQSGLVQTTAPYGQPDGAVAFSGIRWEFSFAYLLTLPPKAATFSGEKMFLKDFIASHPAPGLTILDETYGDHCTKYSGYLTTEGLYQECILEIHHQGDMVFLVEE